MSSFGDELGRCIPPMRRFARALVVGHAVQDADDLVQETIVLAMRSEKISRGAHLRSWCFSTLMRVHRQWGQTTAAGSARHHQAPSSAAAASLSAAKGPLTFIPKEIGRLDLLPLESREVLLLTALVGMNYSQAAEALHVGVETVLVRLDLARNILARGQRSGSLAAAPAEASSRSARAAQYLHVVK